MARRQRDRSLVRPIGAQCRITMNLLPCALRWAQPFPSTLRHWLAPVFLFPRRGSSHVQPVLSPGVFAHILACRQGCHQAPRSGMCGLDPKACCRARGHAHPPTMTLNCPRPPQVVFQSLISTYSNDKLLRSKFSSPEQVWHPCPRPRGAQPLLPRARASSGARLSETCECCAHGLGQGRLSVACERTCRAARTARVPVAVNPPLHHDATHPDMFLSARCVILSAQTRAERQSVSLSCRSKDFGGGDWLARRQVPWRLAPVLLVIAWWCPAAMPENHYPFVGRWQGLACQKTPWCVIYRWS